MRVTRASDYALRVLILLAQPDRLGRTTREEIIEKTGAPPAFLNKVIQRLVRAGLITAIPGVHGGCVLAKPADAISVLQAIEAIDGPLLISECLGEGPACTRCSNCSLRSLLSRLQVEMFRILGSAKVADLVNGVEKGACIVPLASCVERNQMRGEETSDKPPGPG